MSSGHRPDTKPITTRIDNSSHATLSETIENSYARRNGETDELVEIIKRVNNENLENKFFNIV